jgi:hypothetical protein
MRSAQTPQRRLGRKVKNSSENRFSDLVCRQLRCEGALYERIVTVATGFIGSAITVDG